MVDETQCPKCLMELKMVGRSGFCENEKCTIYEILFKRQEMTKEQKEFIELSSQVLNEKGGEKNGIDR